ncbi:MAG: fibronectin type III domain-containing protein [Acidimicrobiales bacterium]
MIAATVALAGLGLQVVPPAMAAGSPVGPAIGSSGLVVTQVRPDSSDFGTALVVRPDGQTLVAAGAGGDFGVAWIDPTFSRGNNLPQVPAYRTTDFGGTNDVARALTLTAAGGSVIAGSAGGDLAVARYDQDGPLDRAFAGDGRLTVDLGGPDDSAYAVAALADGRVLVVGGTASSAVVIRLLPDGRADPTFGTGGRVTVPSSGPGRAAVVQADGKLVVAGGGDRFVAYRFLDTGGLDPSFGQGGVAPIGTGPATANALVLEPNGAITLGGTSGADVGVARLSGAGQPDATFGSAGATVSNFGAVEAGYGLARRDDGLLMLVGDSGSRGLMVAYRPDGSVETSFGTSGHIISPAIPLSDWLATRLRAVRPREGGGWLVAGTQGSDAWVGDPTYGAWGPSLDFGRQRQEVTSSVVQPDGRIVALAEAGDGLALVRHNVDGTLDGGFGVRGMVLNDQVTRPVSVVLQAGGRLVVAGTAATGQNIPMLVAFRPDGSIDDSFANDGYVTGPAPDRWTVDLAVTPDGRLVRLAGAGGNIVLDRFTADGRSDPTFQQGMVVAAPRPDDDIEKLVVQPDGRILVVGLLGAVIRLEASGARDLTFGDRGVVGFRLPELHKPRAVAVQPDGRIVVAGRQYDSMSVIRLMPDGRRDPSWQQNTAIFGTIILGPTSRSDPSTISVEPDGKVLVAGEANGTPGVVRLLPDGRHDSGFGTNGLVVIPENLARKPVLALQTATSGLLVLATAGSPAWPTTGFLLARIATGQLGAPTSVTAVAGSGSARLRWSRPPLFDESKILAYKVTASDGVHTATTPDADHLSAVVKGLTTGRPYTFTVEALRQGVDSASSAPSNVITPGLSRPTSAWGWNGAMNLGDGTAVDRPAPATGVGVSGAVALGAGTYHSIALRADGTVWTWGWNGLGALGDGTTTARSAAVQVPGLFGVTAVASGAYHNVALRSDGTVWTWGWNGFGQLGTGSTGDVQHSPVPVPGLTGVTAIGAGFFHTLGVRPDGGVVAWGWNNYGQLGDGSTTDSPSPKPVPGLAGVKAVAGGALHSLALGVDGGMSAWGWNGVGQLGSRDNVDYHVPHPVPLGYRVTSIAAGAYHTYALRNDGRVSSWGWNAFGQLGNESTGPVLLEVNGLSDVVAIAAGWFHGTAVRYDGSVVAWGDNRYGQLGDGTTASRNTVAPVRVPTAIAVAAGAFHSLSA